MTDNMNGFSKKYVIGILIVCMLIIIPSFVKAQEWYELRVIIIEAKVDLDNPESLEDTLNESLANEGLVNEGLVNERLGVYKNPKEHIAESLEAAKEIALQIGSDMIYGRKFVFVPKDALRGIEESWEFEQVAYIRPDDPKFYDIRREVFNNQIIVIFRYDLEQAQYDWLSVWESANILPGGGVGLVSTIAKDQVRGKKEALLDAYKVAILDRLKEEIINKPLKVRGLVKLAEQPYTAKTDGYYRAKVKVLIKIEEIKAQQVY